MFIARISWFCWSILIFLISVLFLDQVLQTLQSSGLYISGVNPLEIRSHIKHGTWNNSLQNTHKQYTHTLEAMLSLSCHNCIVTMSSVTAICILPCLHGGTCTAPYLCSCRPDYTGVRCQKRKYTFYILYKSYCLLHVIFQSPFITFLQY